MEVFDASGQSTRRIVILTPLPTTAFAIEKARDPFPLITFGARPTCRHQSPCPKTQSAKETTSPERLPPAFATEASAAPCEAAVRRVREAVVAGDQEKAQKRIFRIACKKLGQAAAPHVIHRKTPPTAPKSRLNAAVENYGAAGLVQGC